MPTDTSSAARSVFRITPSSSLLLAVLLGHIADNRQLKPFALVGLDHADDPTGQGRQADQPAKPAGDDPTDQPADPPGQDPLQDHQRYKRDNGLHGVEADERPLVDREEDDPGDPPKRVAKQAGHILGQPGPP